jgi:radical SAM protein with 4Fe4S-binding SPASM domain
MRKSFSKIYVEITNRCNLACPFCPPTRREPGLMSRERFGLVLDRLEGFGRLLYLHVKGEPLLHPELGALLADAGERGFSVSLTTNGSLLEERAVMLLGAGNIRKLSVSLHSHSGSGEARDYWRGVEAFLDLHRARPAFDVSLRLWNREAGRLPAGDQGLISLMEARYPDLIGWEEAPGRGDSVRLDERVYLNLAEEFSWPEPGKPAINEGGLCYALRNQVAILVDGTVVPCCLDGEGVMALGNILETPLAEILDSPRARALYEGFSRRELVEPLCRSCGFLKKRL